MISRPRNGNASSAVPGRPVDELVRELVVVLQPVDELHGLDTEPERRGERQPEELGLPGREGVVIARASDEVVGEVGSDGPRVADVLDREVELLEGEAADLAHHSGDDVVRRVGERMPLRPGGKAFGALLHAEESVRVQAQGARAEFAQ